MCTCDIDTVKGCNRPMGPLALRDLIGLDTTLAVAESLYEELRDQLYAPTNYRYWELSFLYATLAEAPTS